MYIWQHLVCWVVKKRERTALPKAAFQLCICLLCAVLVCVMCSFDSVFLTVVGFSLCYVQFLVCVWVLILDCVMCSLQSRPSSLRSEHALLRSVGRMPACIYSKLVKNKVGVQIVSGGLSSKQQTRHCHI